MCLGRPSLHSLQPFELINFITPLSCPFGDHSKLNRKTKPVPACFEYLHPGNCTSQYAGRRLPKHVSARCIFVCMSYSLRTCSTHRVTSIGSLMDNTMTATHCFLFQFMLILKLLILKLLILTRVATLVKVVESLH